MTPDQTRAIVQRTAEELFNRGDLGVVDELIAENAVDHNEPPGTNCREHFRQVVTMFHAAFPDFHLTVEDTVVEGDKFVARMTMSGTHLGPFCFPPGSARAIPPTGRHFSIQQIRIMRFAEGKMVDSWSAIDLMGLMRQLGVLAQPVAA